MFEYKNQDKNYIKSCSFLNDSQWINDFDIDQKISLLLEMLYSSHFEELFIVYQSLKKLAKKGKINEIHMKNIVSIIHFQLYDQDKDITIFLKIIKFLSSKFYRMLTLIQEHGIIKILKNLIFSEISNTDISIIINIMALLLNANVSTCEIIEKSFIVNFFDIFRSSFDGFRKGDTPKDYSRVIERCNRFIAQLYIHYDTVSIIYPDLNHESVGYISQSLNEDDDGIITSALIGLSNIFCFCKSISGAFCEEKIMKSIIPLIQINRGYIQQATFCLLREITGCDGDEYVLILKYSGFFKQKILFSSLSDHVRPKFIKIIKNIALCEDESIIESLFESKWVENIIDSLNSIPYKLQKLFSEFIAAILEKGELFFSMKLLEIFPDIASFLFSLLESEDDDLTSICSSLNILKEIGENNPNSLDGLLSAFQDPYFIELLQNSEEKQTRQDI